jgi:hypothetical protein
VITLCIGKRGVQMDMNYHGRQVKLTYEMPMAEIVLDFLSKQPYVTSYQRISDEKIIEFIKKEEKNILTNYNLDNLSSVKNYIYFNKMFDINSNDDSIKSDLFNLFNSNYTRHKFYNFMNRNKEKKNYELIFEQLDKKKYNLFLKNNYKINKTLNDIFEILNISYIEDEGINIEIYDYNKIEDKKIDSAFEYIKKNYDIIYKTFKLYDMNYKQKNDMKYILGYILNNTLNIDLFHKDRLGKYKKTKLTEQLDFGYHINIKNPFSYLGLKNNKNIDTNINMF